MRIKPYGSSENILIDVQQVIPLPEAEDYQIKVREKRQVDREARRSRDLTRYNVTVGETTLTNLFKRRAIHAVVKGLCDRGVSPDLIEKAISWKSNLFFVLPGDVGEDEFKAAFAQGSGSLHQPLRWLHADDELIHFGDQDVCFP